MKRWLMVPLLIACASAGEQPSCMTIHDAGDPVTAVACIIASDLLLMQDLGALHDCRVDELLDRQTLRVVGKHYAADKPCKRL